VAHDAWRVATTLPKDGAEPLGFGGYRARSYDHLIDHPVEMGAFDLIEFRVRDVPHRVAITGRHRCDGARLAQDLTRICENQVSLFGDLPIEQYLFLVTAVGEGYGGLEHCDSGSLLCKRDELPQRGQEKVTEGYRRLLALCSYLELLAQNITRVMRTPGRNIQSLTESSFDAWTKLYKPDENAPNAMISYYAKGALVALALDLILRERTDVGLARAGRRRLMS